MSTSVEFIPNKKTENYLMTVGDKVAYKVARITLDLTIPHVPMSRGKPTSGKLRRSTMSYGVKGSNGNYTIGSTSKYAKYVYVMGENTHWTTPKTYGHWFHRTFKEKQKVIFKNAIDQSRKG